MCDLIGYMDYSKSRIRILRVGVPCDRSLQRIRDSSNVAFLLEASIPHVQSCPEGRRTPIRDSCLRYRSAEWGRRVSRSCRVFHEEEWLPCLCRVGDMTILQTPKCACWLSLRPVSSFGKECWWWNPIAGMHEKPHHRRLEVFQPHLLT